MHNVGEELFLSSNKLYFFFECFEIFTFIFLIKSVLISHVFVFTSNVLLNDDGIIIDTRVNFFIYCGGLVFAAKKPRENDRDSFKKVLNDIWLKVAGKFFSLQFSLF